MESYFTRRVRWRSTRKRRGHETTSSFLRCIRRVSLLSSRRAKRCRVTDPCGSRHGGSQSSKFLQQKLHQLLESATAETIPATIDEYRGIGGYLKRYQGGILERFRKESENYNERVGISLDEMSVLAFLQVSLSLVMLARCNELTSRRFQADNAVLADDSTGKSGSTATVALLHSLDLPHSFPYYASSLLSLTISHLGDTTALLSTTAQGRARRLTEPHHGDSRVEGERLRTSGTGIVTDSFGESRWGGTLANTRGIGDREFKSLGVIGEPEITKRVLKGTFLSLLIDCEDRLD